MKETNRRADGKNLGSIHSVGAADEPDICLEEFRKITKKTSLSLVDVQSDIRTK
jgi:hypothetical protein